MPNQDKPLRKLNAAGQSVWCDHIHRAMLTTGGLATMIEYDEILQRALRENPKLSSRELFFALAVEDIRDAADILRPVYEATDGVDGMVSLEVSPDLAHDTEGTIREARDLHARLNRPNVMIKVPATEAGLPAIEQLVADGLNINVTLLFSVERYVAVAE